MKCSCVYATASNTEAVRKGYEMGGYLIQECPYHKSLNEESDEPKDVPNVSDWKVVEQSDGAVYVESSIIGQSLDYDDAWLKVTGNMTQEAKRKLAEFVARKLNRP